MTLETIHQIPAGRFVELVGALERWRAAETPHVREEVLLEVLAVTGHIHQAAAGVAGAVIEID